MTRNIALHKQLDKISPAIRKETAWAEAIVGKIERITKEKGITQRELAHLMGCNESQISRWTRGFPNFTLSSLAKLSEALGEDLIHILI
ncbi:MAG: helix-turn-helix transcriptional regulator [Bacteroidales bacterium]|nr:helix-turn-helix transcriptional regulator [Bacteroidales bacterium]